MNAILERFLALHALHVALARQARQASVELPTGWRKLVKRWGLVGLTSDDCGWGA